MCKSTSSKTGADNVTKVTSDVTNIVKIHLNLSRTVVKFRLKTYLFKLPFAIKSAPLIHSKGVIS